MPNRPQPFRLQASTRVERTAAIQAIEQAIRGAGAWITNYRQFSNSAVVLDIQVAADQLTALYEAIEATGVHLSPPLAELSPTTDADGEFAGTLRLEFVHGEPDSKDVVPAVPG